MIFVDTNYFLRFLISSSKQREEAKLLFEEGALGKKKLFTSIIVFFEIYWVLFSFYRKKKKQLIKILFGILQMNFIVLKERKILYQALEIFSKNNFDLEDSFNLVYARENKASNLASFDRKLIKHFKSLGKFDGTSPS